MVGECFLSAASWMERRESAALPAWQGYTHRIEDVRHQEMIAQLEENVCSEETGVEA